MQSKSIERREPVVFTSQGKKIFGVVHRPLNVEKAPAVLICHGFCANKMGRKRQFVGSAKKLAERGIIALRFDYRGCGDSEGEEVDMGLSSNIMDAKSAMEWLLNDPQVDTGAIGILGRSMGGPISMQVAHAYPAVRSLALWAPVANSASWKRRWSWFNLVPTFSETIWVHDLPYNRGFIGNYFNEFFELEPANVLAELSHLPMLHVHGEKDKIVTKEHLSEYEKYRKEAEGITEWLRLPKCDHGFFEPDDQKLLIETTASWFHKTLNGSPS